jgi:ribosomal protein S20
LLPCALEWDKVWRCCWNASDDAEFRSLVLLRLLKFQQTRRIATRNHRALFRPKVDLIQKPHRLVSTSKRSRDKAKRLALRILSRDTPETAYKKAKDVYPPGLRLLSFGDATASGPCHQQLQDTASRNVQRSNKASRQKSKAALKVQFELKDPKR